jgi:hypothetical protein
LESASDTSKYAGLAHEKKTGHSHVLQKSLLKTQEETQKGITAACVPDGVGQIKIRPAVAATLAG